MLFHVFVGLFQIICWGLGFGVGAGLLLYLSTPTLIHLFLWVTVLAMSVGTFEIKLEEEETSHSGLSTTARDSGRDALLKEKTEVVEPRAPSGDYNVEALVGLYAITFVHVCIDWPPSWHPVLLLMWACLSVLNLTTAEASLLEIDQSPR